jgi:hypothetical protein
MRERLRVAGFTFCATALVFVTATRVFLEHRPFILSHDGINLIVAAGMIFVALAEGDTNR